MDTLSRGAPSGVGVIAIRDYTEAVDGSCEREGVPGQDTKVMVTLPAPASIDLSCQRVPSVTAP